MSENRTVRTYIENDIAWVTIDNPPVNATSTAVREGLESAIAEVADARVAVLISEGRTFIAGGDMSEFDAPPVAPHLPDVVQMIEDSEVPFIAAMHGNVLGGGFEIAMGCAWRIAASGTRFGLPEVNVGVIPGAGGTQRLPRLIGIEPAIDIACAGKIINSEELYRLGGLDRVVEGDLKQAALAFAQTLPPRPTPVSQRIVEQIDEATLTRKKAEVLRRAKGQHAPLDNFDALTWAARPFSEAQPKERELHLALRKSSESRALRHAFFAERQVAKPAAIAGATAREVEHIAVVGDGLMGAGIAASALNAGLKVTLIERDKTAANAAHDRVTNLLDGALKRGKIDAARHNQQLNALRTSDAYSDAAPAQLAVEAVFEDASVKQAVFRELAASMDRNAILATNTSYLDPTVIFAGIENPSRCIGLHFFSPAHIMKLLEIVKTPETQPNVLATGFALGKRMRKVSVLSGICDGFIGNRMLAAYRREADYLLADGALPYQVDVAMRAFGVPMGPYEMQDLTGLQIAWANRKRQAADRDSKERYVPIGDQLCEMDRLGQRSGRGWYLYDGDSRKPRRDPEVEQMIADYSAKQGINRQNFTEIEISSRLLAVLANEGAQIVEDGIAEGFSEIDMVQIHGYGFPRWRGGPMHYASEIGWQTTSETMTTVAGESPNSWRLANMNDEEPKKLKTAAV